MQNIFAGNLRCECEITAFDIKPERITVAGDLNGIAEHSKPVFKIFKFQRTKLFVTASVDYSELQSGVTLFLAIGKQGIKGDLMELSKIGVSNTALTTIPVTNFENGSVSTFYIRNGMPVLVTLECSVKEELEVKIPK